MCRADVCVLHRLSLPDAARVATVQLDGARVAAHLDGPMHICAPEVGCGAGGEARMLTMA